MFSYYVPYFVCIVHVNFCVWDYTLVTIFLILNLKMCWHRLIVDTYRSFVVTRPQNNRRKIDNTLNWSIRSLAFVKYVDDRKTGWKACCDILIANVYWDATQVKVNSWQSHNVCMPSTLRELPFLIFVFNPTWSAIYANLFTFYWNNFFPNRNIA